MLLLALLACNEHILVTSILAGTTQDGHYILVNDEGKVFDCLSRPDGKTWNPTCVAVEYHNSYEPAREGDDKR